MKWTGCLLVIFFAGTTVARAQSSDFGVWAAIETEKKLSKKWSINGELDFRTMNGLSTVRRWTIKPGVEYNAFKFLKAGAAYQFIYFYDAQYSDFQPRHRFITYVQGKQKWSSFTFTLRERVQVTTKDESDRIKVSGKIDTYKMNPEWTWRNRLAVSYNIPNSRFEPGFSFESFYQLNNPDGNNFDGLRYILSTEYKLNKKNSIEIYGVFDKDSNLDLDATDRWVLGFNYKFRL